MRIHFLLSLLVALSVLIEQGEVSGNVSDPQTVQCHERSMLDASVVRVYHGEVGRLGCPVSHHLSAYNYSLIWYRVQPDQGLEKPINVSLPNPRITADHKWLWFQPAFSEDAGQYVCVVRNGTHDHRTTLQLEVLLRANNGCVSQAAEGSCVVKVPLEESAELNCPDLQEFQLSPKSTPVKVKWSNKNCSNFSPKKWVSIVNKDSKIVIHIMRQNMEGNYTCVVEYHSGGKTLSFTRVVTLKAKSSSRLPKTPIIHNPNLDQIFTVKLGSEGRLECRALVFDEDLKPQLWWEVNGKTLQQLSDSRFTNITSYKEDELGDRTMMSVLLIQKFSSQDLHFNYTCHAHNTKGSASRTAKLQPEEYLPSVELGCGLGVVLVVTLVLFVVYHVYHLELLLLYRAYCGPDESATDRKEYDVYISYARNSEEETFVLLTLRRVLENELGYKVFIFDRDSLPGGTITDETLSYVGRSRRLMVVLSPNYLVQGTQALLELKAGLDAMAQAGDLRVILVQYQPISRDSWVRELRRARVALALIQWKGEKSSDLSSRFWKQLQVELPVRRRKNTLSEDSPALPMTTYTHTYPQ
ncbi:hypothetical protein AGOR_G00127400 [Albula goreensis]|uniref:Uncharacterized protein n=1 Tax=Albula goreensis TaxID=1534307 RepID=A0A8T3DAM3_9TELE|nr:hypothetical protein AGOR_G00127400 [Albula goreensis]